MRSIIVTTLLLVLPGLNLSVLAQIIQPDHAHAEINTHLSGQIALQVHSGPGGEISPPPTHPNSIGLRSTGFTGIWAEGKGSSGQGIFATGTLGAKLEGIEYGLTSQGNVGGYFKGQSSGIGIEIAGVNSPWGGGSDDAVIRSQQNQSSGDLIFVSNDYITFHLDDDQNTFGGEFQVLNSYDDIILELDQNGFLETHIYIYTSDRNQKEAVVPLDKEATLKKLCDLPVTEWQFKDKPGRHVGPMAQDFAKAFGYGKDDKTISVSDMQGVTLLAVQALQELVDQQEQRIKALEKMIGK